MEIRQKKLLEFVKIGHYEQKRKYTGEPYFTHPLRVGLEAQKLGIPFGLEIGMCHDLFEDTTLKSNILIPFLFAIGYQQEEVQIIIAGTLNLTDHFVKETYPKWNRDKRKEEENKRLALIPKDTQTIKYLDCIDNAHSICANDPHFSHKYLKEIMTLIIIMDKGDAEVLSTLKQLLIESMSKISEEVGHDW